MHLISPASDVHLAVAHCSLFGCRVKVWRLGFTVWKERSGFSIPCTVCTLPLMNPVVKSYDRSNADAGAVIKFNAGVPIEARVLLVNNAGTVQLLG